MILDLGRYKAELLWTQLPGLIGVIIGIWIIITYIIQDKENVQINIKTYIRSILLSAAMIFLLYSCIINLRFGIYLLFESEDDSIINTGVIESVEELKWVQSDQYEQLYCELVIIDGERYVFAATGNLEVGDIVTIEYLPQSRIVLEWQYEIE